MKTKDIHLIGENDRGMDKVFSISSEDLSTLVDKIKNSMSWEEFNSIFKITKF